MTAASHLSAADPRRGRHDAAVAAVAAGLVSVERGQLRLARCVSEIAAAIDVVHRLLPSGGLVVVLTSRQDLVDHVAAWWHRERPDASFLLTGKLRESSNLPRDALRTMSSDIIATWVHTDTSKLRVLVGLHRHADLIGEGLLKAGAWADLLIVHEAHHTAGYAKRGAAVHDDKLLPAAARLYATAAPRVYRRTNTPPANTDEVALSMDEEEVFGPVLHEYSAEQAIADGVAPRFRLRLNALPPVAPGRSAAPTTQAASAYGYVREDGSPQTFCAHRDSRTIEVAIAEALTPANSTPSDHDSPCCSDPDAAGVTIAVTQLDATVTATITPASEATDNAWAEVVRSHTGLRHTLRALRHYDPAFGSALDAARAHGTDRHHDLSRWITIQFPPDAPNALVDDLLAAVAYAAADSWWVGYGHLADHQIRTGNAIVPYGHKVRGYPLGQWYCQTRSTYRSRGLPLDRVHALHALSTPIDTQHATKRQRRWNLHIAEATAFHTRYHHLDVDLPGVEASKELRIWLARVRTGAWPVSETERDALDALGMLWDDPPLLRRKGVADAFADYHARHGHLEFADDLVVDVRGAPARLLNWVTVFRREHRLGSLHPEVRRTLQDVGFVFDPDAAWWDDLITTARRYHELHGDLDVAPGAFDTAAGECLLTALQACRSRWRRRRFDPGRAATLDALDPLWGTDRRTAANPPPPPPSPPSPPQPTQQPVLRRPVPRPQPVPSASAAWQAGLQAAWRHRNQIGHLLPATDYRDPLTNLLLMQWLSAQRRGRRNGRLTPEQIAALDALDMIWDPAATFRTLGVQHARSYHAQHGHLRVPTTDPYHGTDARGEPFNLYNALARARKDHANDTLHPDWRRALDELGYDYAAFWSPLPDYVAALEEYHSEHGDLNIDPQHPTYLSLKRVNVARHQSRLPAELQQRLADIGYDYIDRFTDWDHVFATVQQFFADHGHIEVPSDLRSERPDGGQGPLVRTWLANQRRRLQVGVTTEEQKKKLDAVGFIWDVEEADWMEKYRLACRFQQEHGHLAVGKVHVREKPDWTPLPAWLRKQKTLRAAGHLSDKRIKLLDLVGMLWVERPGRERHWDQRLRQVDEFRRTHGNTHILAQLNQTTDPRARAELKKLAAWLNDQLVYAKRGTLRTDRREKLTAIGLTVPKLPSTKDFPIGSEM